MTTQAINKRWVKRLDQWLALVENLLADVSQWASAQDWSIHRDQKEIREDPIGLYSAPTLRIRLPGGEIHVEPVALRITGEKGGRVDIESWPSLNRVMLIRNGEKWRVLTDSGVSLAEPWNEKTFIRVVREMNAP